MSKFYYYLALIVIFFVLWAMMITLFVIMEECGYKPGGVLYTLAFFVIFGIIGGLKPWLKKKFKIK